jgi:hypothetical protein
MGSGRACYGMLTITAHAITWMTPFSQCRPSRYSVVDRSEGPDGLRVTYQLQQPSRKCLYPVLVLSHGAGAHMDIGWNVEGRASLEDASLQRTEDGLGCYLYRPAAGK